jgi:hypothetical protein
MIGFGKHPRKIEILAPDASTAFALEKQLAHLSPTAIGSGLGWSVELEDSDDRLDEIQAAVKQWLRDGNLRSTVIRIDGAVRGISVGPPPKDGPLGAGYDGSPVLTHEP